MSKKRYIDDSFWTDPYIEKLDLMEKAVFLYLLTNPLCNVLGIYEISMKRLAYETGLDVDAASNILDRFVRDKKIFRVEEWVILLNYGKHQVLNPSIESGVRRIWGELPDWVQAVAACDSLSYFTLLNLTYRDSVVENKNTTKNEPIKTYFKAKKKTTKLKKQGNAYCFSKELCAIFSEELGGQYLAERHLLAGVNLFEQHGPDKVREVADFAMHLKPKEYQVKIGSPYDLAEKWPKVIELMNKPKPSIADQLFSSKGSVL